VDELLRPRLLWCFGLLVVLVSISLGLLHPAAPQLVFPAIIMGFVLWCTAIRRHLLFSTVGCVVLLLMVQVALPGSVGLGETLVTTILFASIAVAFAYIRANGLAATEREREIAEKMESQARSYADEIARSEVRYATLFSDMNHAHAEQDISEAKRMIDKAKANGATSFERLAAENPEFIDRCLAAVKVNRVNDALLNMMGYVDHAELVAKPPTENAVDSRRVMQEQLHAMFDGRHHFASTATLIGKDNRKVTVAVGVNVPDDWSVSLSTHIDITEQLRDREAILSAREDLARASRALAVGAISTTLSHELNQPLLAIGLGTKSAERWLERTPPRLEEVARSLEGIRLNADRMSAIIRNTRDKLVKGAKEPRRVDLRQLLTETSYVLEDDLAARHSRMQLSLDDDAIEVMADRTDIQQVFINLITNAAEAMAQVECERIVTITSRRSTEQRLTIEVSDNGPGISDENLKLVFQPFFSTKSGGMGMGLQICRSIIESFGGTLNVRNNQGRGATFIISLPLPPASDTGQAPQHATR